MLRSQFSISKFWRVMNPLSVDSCAEGTGYSVEPYAHTILFVQPASERSPCVYTDVPKVLHDPCTLNSPRSVLTARPWLLSSLARGEYCMFRFSISPPAFVPVIASSPSTSAPLLEPLTKTIDSVVMLMAGVDPSGTPSC